MRSSQDSSLKIPKDSLAIISSTWMILALLATIHPPLPHCCLALLSHLFISPVIIVRSLTQANGAHFHCCTCHVKSSHISRLQRFALSYAIFQPIFWLTLKKIHITAKAISLWDSRHWEYISATPISILYISTNSVPFLTSKVCIPNDSARCTTHPAFNSNVCSSSLFVVSSSVGNRNYFRNKSKNQR